MQKNSLVLFGVAGLAIAGYLYFSKQKKSYAELIVQYGGLSSLDTLLKFDTGYLKAWSEALQINGPYFIYKQNKYAAKGGRRIP